jgi:hypothetical protein
MTNKLTLLDVDRDGAIEEAFEKLNRETSRRGFLGRTGLLTGGLIGGGAVLGTLAGPASAATATDVAIANFALTLEYLEAEFYTQAEAAGALSDELADFARVVGQHERDHVAALKKMLGSAAVAKPTFDFKGTTEDPGPFAETAQVLEDTGVAAYKGQAPRIDTDAILNAALAIHSVEARHAAWIRHINGAPPAPEAFDAAMSMDQILAAVTNTGFITSQPSMTGQGDPSFTG